MYSTINDDINKLPVNYLLNKNVFYTVPILWPTINCLTGHRLTNLCIALSTVMSGVLVVLIAENTTVKKVNKLKQK